MSQEKISNTSSMVEPKSDTHLQEIELITEAEHRNELGEDAVNLEGYWGSWPFIGSVTATILMANSLFCGYAMPVSLGDPVRCTRS